MGICRSFWTMACNKQKHSRQIKASSKGWEQSPFINTFKFKMKLAFTSFPQMHDGNKSYKYNNSMTSCSKFVYLDMEIV